ncbi:MAG: GAF domain-containing protein [Pseudomonadota bacterium]
MNATQLSVTDEDRIETLQSYHVLDTRAEASFDRITQLASRLFDVPIAVISLVDNHRQWFKSKTGIEACSTDRDIAFCDHAIRQDDIYEVLNPTTAPEFRDNPLVTGSMMNIRFYAGMPLRAYNGDKLGTLCLISETPREALTEKERLMLKDLAAITMHQLELRRASLNSMSLVHEAVRENRLVSV